MTRTLDITLALGLGAAQLAALLIFGDPVYLGPWYYVLAWCGLAGMIQLLKAPPLSTLGATTALSATFLGYWAWQASLSRPEGLLGLGHLFSLPGLVLAAVVVALLARRRGLPPATACATTFVACCAGFGIAQLVVCRTALYCGPLSGM
ncbi:hypothetical protein [Duganella sp. Root1480D1]|uniref:hypothetical protein n=1 Tax=Duganella sp. Root1480D1 TaxID=1736471 RepID=UPI00070F3CDA|nr:hypothetical protein [Duganella sp. Root1480D1]KQZ31804.1 hypothetical protein ASD58_29795 [Duganella sp. Root1480D1]